MPSNCEGLHWLLQQLYIYERSFVCLQKELSLFSSFWFDNPGNAASPIYGRFSCRSLAPLVGDGDDIITELAWVTMNGIAQCLFFWKGKGQIPFFKAHHPSTEKSKALVWFKPRTEPVLGIGDSHSTSTPPPPSTPDQKRKVAKKEL